MCQLLSQFYLLWTILVMFPKLSLSLELSFYNSGISNMINLPQTSNLSGHKSNLSRRACPCAEDWMCDRIRTPPRREVFVFSVSTKTWRLYDWSKITTVVAFSGPSVALMCHAHSHGARVVTSATIPTPQLTNSSARARWVAQRVREIQENYLDGVNVDYEGEVDKDQTAQRDGLTALVRALVSAVKALGWHLQVTADFAWSPEGVDQRWYDYAAIAGAVDFTFIMAYSERSQVLTGPCVAWANSAYNATRAGLLQYLKLGIPPAKLVLGVPWNGMQYPCERYDAESRRCDLRRVPFRAATCSDNAGECFSYGALVADLVPRAQTGILWDADAQTPYFMYLRAGQTYQVWYDDPRSLAHKYDLVDGLGLRGVGMWNADQLDYTRPGQVNDMWGGLPGRGESL